MFTVHDQREILDEAVDNPEGLSCGSPSFVLRQSAQPLQNTLHSNALLSKNVPDRFDCDVINNVTR